jgi:Phage integrase, N-terminal SAM-like domain
MKQGKSRKSNGQGYTYRVGNSWKTVIESQGRVVTATAKSQQESRRRAKEKVLQLEPLNNGIVMGSQRVTLGDYLLPWLDYTHKNKIAYGTYRRYRGIAVRNIVPALGNLTLATLSSNHIITLMENMASAGMGPRSQNQALALLSKALQSAVNKGLIKLNVAKGVAKTPETPTCITPLNENEVILLLQKAEGTFMHARFISPF